MINEPTDDEREALAAAQRLDTFLSLRSGMSAHDKDLRLVLDALRRTEVSEPKVVTLDDVYEVTGLEALVAEARSRGEWCCENGCGSGACETCPCCAAGWCVSGVDGVPEDAEAREFWLEVAAEHNPVAAALRAAAAETSR